VTPIPIPTLAPKDRWSRLEATLDVDVDVGVVVKVIEELVEVVEVLLVVGKSED
jgi:hypothetical protein